MEPLALLALAVFLGVYALTTAKILNKGLAAMAGAGLIWIAILGFSPSASLGLPWLKIDWNAVLVLPAMAVFASLLQKTGVAQYLAIRFAKLVHGSPRGLLALGSVAVFVLSFLIGTPAALTLFLPVTFLITAEMSVPLAPFLTAQVVFAATGGLLSPIGGIAPLLISSGLGINYTSYFLTMLPFAAAATLALLVVFPLFWGKRLHVTNERKARVLDFDETRSLQAPRVLVTTLAALGVVTVLFFLSGWLSLGLAVPAWLGAAVLLLLTQKESGLAPETAENAFPLFLIGILLVVQGLAQTGLTARWGAWLAQTGSTAGASWAILGVSGLVSAFLDNVPWATAAVPVFQAAFKSLHHARWADPQSLRLWVPFVVGSTLGAGATLWGMASSLALLGPRKNGVSISAGAFARTGLLVLTVQLLAVGLLLMCLYPAR